MSSKIKFGTDGWRGIIADDFTFNNVGLVSRAYAEQILEDLKNNLNLQNLVYIGYDRRFLSEEFAKESAKVLSGKGLKVNLYSTDVPTPVVSFDVKNSRAAGGIVITASHNPPEFSGFKIKQPSGCSASKSYTDMVERRLESSTKAGSNVQQYTTIEPSKIYIDFIKKTIDLEKLKSQEQIIIIDSMYGCGGKYIENLLSGGKLKIITLRADRDVTFGGINPEPMMPQLEPLSREVIQKKAVIGLATDGDADRVGAIDDNGEYLNTHKILAILLYYLAEVKKLTGNIALTFSQSVLVKKMAQKYGFKVHEVPIGFKNIAELMLKDDILIGGEEANGIGCKLHCIPERDGIFNALLLFEAISTLNLKPTELVQKLHTEFGSFFYDRIDMHIKSPEFGKKIVEGMKSRPPAELNGLRLKEVQDLDGTKLIFEDDSWLLFRSSGTEPLLRIYSEAKTKESVQSNLAFGKQQTKVFN